ncbi:hypothetical protein [Lentzea sp. NPDC059081]|uniref:hypothetical protein n=1 Tax=Lentzea sp. NPDC059081 TaxID=3346719 RepID=UPI0036A59399
MFDGRLSLRRLRRRCAARVRELPMPDPFDVRALCDLVAGQRGRPIELVPITERQGVLGLWVATDDSDLIFYEEATTLPHQDHIILHELCHLLCDHYAAPLPGAELMPHLDPEMVRSVLGRTGYSAVEEQEAELLASLILQQAGQPAAPPAEGLAHRISDALNWSDPR